jgi:enoyl-CoA hydratase/carnithine racemase
MLLLADMISAAEAAECRFAELVPEEEIEARVEAVCRRLGESAPLTVRASREAMRRLAAAGLPDGDDLIRMVYGSEDFRAGVRAFSGKQRPVWRGR